MPDEPEIPRPVCYSTSLNYVFIHIPKCAGTSIHRALGRLHERARLPIDKKLYHKHTKARDVQRILGPIWDNAFTFAFVRNPWDLMVSSYHWWLTHAERYPSLATQAAQIKKMGGFDTFIRSEFGSTTINEQRGDDLLDWISDNNQLIVKFIGRYENLGSDWRRICEQLGVDPIELTIENPVTRADYRSFYTDSSRQVVAKRFDRTIRLFGYEF